MPTPRYYAFFDLDGTLIHTRSLLSFLQFAKDDLDRPQGRIARFESSLRRKFQDQDQRESLNRFFYTCLAGQSVAEITRIGRIWLEEMEQSTGFYNTALQAEIAYHRAAGARIVIVTGSFRQLAEPLAERLQVDEVLCTELEMYNGVFTGQVLGEPCIGNRKLSAIQELLAATNIHLDDCFAYGDDVSDLPMLRAVGWPNRIIAIPSYHAELALYLTAS